MSEFGDGVDGHTRRNVLRLTAAGLAGLPALSGPARGDPSRGGTELWVHDDVYLTTGGSLDATIVGGTAYYMPNRNVLVAVDVLESNREGDAVVDWIQTFVGEYDVSDFTAPFSTPSVVGGTVYVEGDAGVFAVDADDGTHEWFAELNESNIASAPTATEERVYVTTEEGVYALSADDGSVVWEQSFSASEQYSTNLKSAPAVAEGTVFVGTEERFVALDPGDGTEEWAFAGRVDGGDDEKFLAAPTVVDGTVYARSLHDPIRGAPTEVVYALGVANGAERWRRERPAPGATLNAYSSPTVADGRLVVGSAGEDDVAYALDVEDGDEVWSFAGADEDSGSKSSPTVADGRVFVGGLDRMYAVALEDGAEQWTWTDEGASRNRIRTGNVSSSPTVVDGVVFFVYAGALFALYGGVRGSSVGSRVELGTLGHHHAWAGEPPQNLLSTVIGTVTGPEGDPVEDAAVYVATSDQAHRGLELLEEYPDGPDPAEELDLTSPPTGTDEEGSYVFPSVGSGQFFVTVLPPESSGYTPTLVSDVDLEQGDETVVDVALSDHPLACLDPAVEQLQVRAQRSLDRSTEAAADTLVEGGQVVKEQVFPSALDLFEQLVGVDLGNVAVDFEDEAAETLVNAGIDYGVESFGKLLNVVVDELSNALQGELGESVEALQELGLFTEFEFRETTPEDLAEGAYGASPLYRDAASRITASTEAEYDEITGEYDDPADLGEFSVPDAKAQIRDVVRQFGNPDFGVPGRVVAPSGDVYDVDQAETNEQVAERTQDRIDDVGELQEAAGAVQAIGGALVATGVGAVVGAKLVAVANRSQKALETVNFLLKIKLLVDAVVTQIYWGLDTGRTAAAAADTVAWLEGAIEAEFSRADVTITDLDMNLQNPVEEVEEIPKYAVANRPQNPEGDRLVDSQWSAVEEAGVEVSNRGDESKTVRVTMYDVFGGRSTTSLRGASSDRVELAPGESRTLDLEYEASYLGLQDHTMMVHLWSEGSVRDTTTKHFHVRPSATVGAVAGGAPPSGADRAHDTAHPDGTVPPSPGHSRSVAPSLTAVEDQRSTTTTVLEGAVSPDSKVLETTHVVGEDTREVEYTLTAPGDVALLVTDPDGNALGYDPGENRVRTELPDATYEGPTVNPRVASFTAEPGTEYTIRAIGYRFFTGEAIDVTVRAWETPDRDPLLELSPRNPRAFLTSGADETVDLTLREFGGQEAIESASVDAAAVRREGLSVTVEDDDVDVPPGERRTATLAFEADDDYPPGDAADTRLEDEVTVETDNAGSATVTLSALAMRTDVSEARLVRATRDVTGVSVTSADVGDLPDPPADLDVDPGAAYELTVTGSGSVTVAVPQDLDRAAAAAYAVDESWRDLSVGQVDGRIRARLAVDDGWDGFLVVEENPVEDSGDDSGGDDQTGGDSNTDSGPDPTTRARTTTTGGGGGVDVLPSAVGVGAALTAAAGAGYALKQRIDDSE